MQNYALLLEYNGIAFNGFQKQKDKTLITVQGEIENALEIVLKEKIKTHVAGRTDAGVHAKGMVLNFHSEKKIQIEKLIISINAIANKEVSILNGVEVPKNFHARFSCTEREYEYLILNTKFSHPLYNQKAYWLKSKMDINLLEKIAKDLEGIHDFASFTKKNSLETYSSTVRNIKKISIEPDSELKGLFKISIKGSGFLHNMIRITIGTILDIAKGKIKTDINEILQNKERTTAGVTLPAHGLYFKKAYYNDFPEIENMYNEIFALS